MGGVCAPCWKRLTFIADPLCARCGLPFDYDPGAGSLCGACVSDAPLFDRARAALAYDDGSRSILVGLKHNRTHNATTLADWMTRSGEALIHEADLICAVPLHRWRLLKRGYNQAGLLAASGCPAQRRTCHSGPVAPPSPYHQPGRAFAQRAAAQCARRVFRQPALGRAGQGRENIAG